MSLLPAEIENLTETEAEFFNEGFRMDAECVAEIDGIDVSVEAKPATVSSATAQSRPARA
jgi:hypothetical protein